MFLKDCPDATELPPDNPWSQLHASSFGRWKTKTAEFFKERTVARDEKARIGGDLGLCTVLTLPTHMLAEFGVHSCLVRGEFQIALQVIFSFVMEGKSLSLFKVDDEFGDVTEQPTDAPKPGSSQQNIPQKRCREEIDRNDTGGNSCTRRLIIGDGSGGATHSESRENETPSTEASSMSINSDAGALVSDSSPLSNSLGAKPTHPQAHQRTDTISDSAGVAISNPFLDERAGKATVKGGVIVIGHPGIGKTIWLYFVLILRLLAGRPTVLVLDSKSYLVFTSHGVFVISLLRESPTVETLRPYIPQETWCLVDSNDDLLRPPLIIQKLRLFVVQATSPCINCLGWQRKVHSVSRYFMKPWSLDELVAGRMLHIRDVPSELELRAFFDKYGPSAYSAYEEAMDTTTYEEELVAQLDSMDPQTLEISFKSTASLSLADSFSHRLFVIYPGVHRHDHYTTFTSSYVYRLICNRVYSNSMQAAAHLHDLFARNRNTKATARLLLEEGARDLFCKGGEWEIRPLTKGTSLGTKNQRYYSPTLTAQEHFLCLGFDKDRPLILPHSLESAEFRPLQDYRFAQDTTDFALRRDNVYYRGVASDLSVLDGFVFHEATETAIMFQVIVTKEQDVNVGGFEWLFEEVGVRNLCYVAVIPVEHKLDLAFPHEWDERVEKYALEVPDLLVPPR